MTLDTDLKDSSGLPGARVAFRLHDNDHPLLSFGISGLGEIAAASGARRLGIEPLSGRYCPSGWHLKGPAA